MLIWLVDAKHGVVLTATHKKRMQPRWGKSLFTQRNPCISIPFLDNLVSWNYIGPRTVFAFETSCSPKTWALAWVAQRLLMIPQTVLALRGSGGVGKKGLWFVLGSVRATPPLSNISFYMVWWGSLSSRAGEMVGRERFCCKTQWFCMIFLSGASLSPWVPSGCLLGASGCFLGAFWVPLGAFCAWMPGCLDAWMPGCQDAWMPGCLDAWISIHINPVKNP